MSRSSSSPDCVGFSGSFPSSGAARLSLIHIYHLNIGQPDVQTPPAFFEAIRKFEQPVLEYAPSPGIPELIDAIKGYYLSLIHISSKKRLAWSESNIRSRTVPSPWSAS